ncbi:SufS family cysteine desulfurase [bacterium]|nr:SufS family cysteine desulfurase [bacterium]
MYEPELFAKIRADFPILNQVVNGKPLAYLDSAASSHQPKQVLDAVYNFLNTNYANIHRGIYGLSETSTRLYDEARQRVADFIGVEDTPTVIFTRNTTESINLVAYTWGQQNIGEGDSIALPVLEHHSDLIPWQQLAQRKKANLHWIEILPDGTLDLESLEEALSFSPKLLAFTWVSNVFGTINPVEEIVRRARSKSPSITIMLDGAQGVPHLPTDVKKLGVDFLAFSGHKMLAPTGIGVLWGRRKLLESMPAFLFGGSMISSVKRDRSSWDVLPNKYEAGTPNISGAIGLGEACSYLKNIGMEKVHAHDQDLMRYAIERLNDLEGAEILGPLDTEKRCGALSFYFKGLHPHDIATMLGREGVCVRAGHHCCQPLMREIGMMGTTRLSFHVYNNYADIDRLIEALRTVSDVFKGITCNATCAGRKLKVIVQSGHHVLGPDCPKCCQQTCTPNPHNRALGNTMDSYSTTLKV